MTFGEKLRRARREKGLTQAELADQAGLGLRTIIAYEKGETYPQKAFHLPDTGRRPWCAGGRPAQRGDHGQRTAADPHPVENSKRRYEELLPDGPAWPGDSSYEAYCEKVAQLSKADAAHNFCNSTGKELPQITIRPALTKDFPTLLQICKDRCQFDATRAGADKSKLPTFESQLETLTRSLVAWISAGQCFLMESNGRPGAGSSCSCPRQTPTLLSTKEKAARRQRPPRRCPAPPCWALIQAPILQVFPNTCSPSAKPAARGWRSKSHWTTRSAGSAWPTGWTRALYRPALTPSGRAIFLLLHGE